MTKPKPQHFANTQLSVEEQHSHTCTRTKVLYTVENLKGFQSIWSIIWVYNMPIRLQEPELVVNIGQND